MQAECLRIGRRSNRSRTVRTVRRSSSCRLGAPRWAPGLVGAGFAGLSAALHLAELRGFCRRARERSAGLWGIQTRSGRCSPGSSRIPTSSLRGMVPSALTGSFPCGSSADIVYECDRDPRHLSPRSSRLYPVHAESSTPAVPLRRAVCCRVRGLVHYTPCLRRTYRLARG